MVIMAEWLFATGNKILMFVVALGWFSFCLFCLLFLICVITSPIWVGFEQSQKHNEKN